MIQNNMSVRKNKRQARKYPSTDFLLLLCIMLFCRCSIHQSNERINLEGTWRFARPAGGRDIGTMVFAEIARLRTTTRIYAE